MIDDVDGLPAVAFADLFCAHHVNVTKTYGVQYNFGCEYHPFRGGHNFRTKRPKNKFWEKCVGVWSVVRIGTHLDIISSHLIMKGLKKNAYNLRAPLLLILLVLIKLPVVLADSSSPNDNEHEPNDTGGTARSEEASMVVDTDEMGDVYMHSRSNLKNGPHVLVQGSYERA